MKPVDRRPSFVISVCKSEMNARDYSQMNTMDTPRSPASEKSLDIDRFMETLTEHYPEWNAPVVTLMAGRGRSAFEILVSTILSLRTKDEVTLKASERLFAEAKTPHQILGMDVERLEKLIYPVGFYPTKARRLQQISRILIEKYQGRVPETLEALLELPGVGRKTANLVMIEGWGQPAVCVDTHVHRISNRIGYVKTRTPDQTEQALRSKLPHPYWIRYNELLVAFGQTVCRPVSPWCSRCPVAGMCPRVNVNRSR